MRRVVYFATVGLTAVLTALPALDWLYPLHGPGPAATDRLLDAIRAWPQAMEGFRSFSDWAIVLAGEAWNWARAEFSWLLTWIADNKFFPGWLEPWLRSFARHPFFSLACGVAALWLFVRKGPQIQDQIRARSEYAWDRASATSADQPPERHWTDRIARAIRTNGPLLVLYDWMTRIVVPVLLAIVVALPACLLVVWFFLPKFVRNKSRRRKYLVKARATSSSSGTGRRAAA
jgi:hypothetical protein